MSDVDKRVVQMDFDNKKFERNVKESTESIGKLKKSLNFDGVSNSIDQVSVKIKALEVVTTTALVNITNRVVNLGIQMIKSLSVDNISTGWAKYGQKTTSVATMMAQNFKVAGKELTDTSEKMSVVTEQLERLNWFSYETSYTFTDMVDNVGKFIAAGQDLDVSVKAMEGIATWAALSGQNASTASRAMYQLSQAMGKGKIQLIDYKSIQNANMDTVEFRQTILDAAVALGQLTKEGDKFVTKTGKKFTQNQFAEELSSGWFTSEVLVKGLSKYSSAVEQIYELANKEGLTASEVIEKYGDDLDTFGLKAFKAAQEARTFADVLSSVKDAVSSKWMTTSELIFGDKNESVSLWTDLSNALYEVFAESGNFRNEILKVWKSLSGREDLFKRGGDDQGAFWNIYDAIVSLKDLIKSAWNTIFPLSEMEDESAQAQDIGNKLKTLTGNLKAFTKRLQMSEATSLRLKKVFEGLFSVLKSFLTILKAIRYILNPVIELGKQLITAVIDKLISLFGRININGNKFIKLANKLHDALEKLFDATIDFSGIFKTIIKTLKAFINALSNVFKKISEFIKSTGVIEKIANSLTNFWSSFINAAKDFGKIFKNTISKVFNSMNSLFDKTAKKMQKLSPVFDKVKSSFQGFIDVVKKVPSTISNFVKSLFGSKIAENMESKVLRPTTKSLKKFSKTVEDVKDSASTDAENKKKELSPIKELFSGIGKLFAGIGILLQSLVVVIGCMIGMIGQVLGGLGTIIELAYKGELQIEEWQKWLIGITIGLGAILGLVALIATKAYNIFYSLLAIVKPVGVLVDSLSGLIDKTALKMMGRFIESIGYTILQISISLMIIAGIDSDKLWPAVATMTGIAAVIGGILAAVLIIQKKTRQISTALTIVEGTAATVKGGISGLIGQIKGSTSEAKKLNNIRSLAIVIQNFGTAMVKIALALYVIGQLDWPDLGKGLIVIGATLAELLLLAKFTNVKEVDIKKAIPGTIQMIALAVLIRSFGRVLKSFVGLDETGLKNVTVAFALVSGFLIATFGMLSLLNHIAQQEGDTKSSSKVIGQLMAMSLLIFSFGVSVRMLAGIKWQKLAFVIGIITVFLYAFAGLSATLAASQLISGGIEANFDIIAEMLSMSLLLFSFGVSVRVLASIEWDKLYQIIGAIAIFFTEFAALTLGLQYIAKLTDGVDASNIIKQMLSMSLLLFSFGVTARMLADIEWNKLYQIVGVIALFFVSFGAMELLISTAGRISKGVESATKQLLVMSLLLFSFGVTARMLADIEWQNILTAAGAIGLVMLAFGGIIAIMNITKGKTDAKSTMAGIALSVIALSAALLIMVNVFKQFEEISWESIGKGAAVVAGSFILLGVASAILSPIIGVILLLSSSIVLLGAGMALSATSILLVIHALQELSAMSAVSIQATTDSLNALAELIATALLAGLQSLFDGISTLLPSLFNMIGTFIDEVLNLLNDKIPAIADTALGLIDKVLFDIKERSSSIFNSIFGIIGNFFSELTKDSRLEKLTENVSKMIVQIFDGIAKKADDIVSSILNFILSLVNGIFNNRQLLSDIVAQVLNLIMDLLVKIVKSIVQLAGAIAKVVLILIAAAFRIVIASLGGLASLFIEFIAAVLLILVHTIIGMINVIYQVFKTIVYNLINIFNQVLMDVGPMLAVWLKTGFQSLLAGILEAIAILIKDVPVLQALYDPIHNAAEDMKSSVKNTMDEYSDILRGDNVLTAVRNASTNIKYVVKESSSQIKSTLTDSIGDINDAVADSSEELSKSMNDFAKGFQMNTNEGQKQSEKAGKDITEGLKNGIEDNIDDVKKAGAAAGGAAVDGAREETDTHSPSRVMFKLGQYLVDGLSLGITDKKDEAVDSMTKMVSQAINATQDTIENQNGDDLTLKVGLDISGVEAQSRKITDIMSGINNVEATAYGRNALYTAKRLNKRTSSEDKTVTQDDHSSTVTYNNVFNVNSTDPERSAEEIDKALSRQAARARLARGAV